MYGCEYIYIYNTKYIMKRVNKTSACVHAHARTSTGRALRLCACRFASYMHNQRAMFVPRNVRSAHSGGLGIRANQFQSLANVFTQRNTAGVCVFLCVFATTVFKSLSPHTHGCTHCPSRHASIHRYTHHTEPKPQTNLDAATNSVRVITT